jgi:uncharacterized protein YdeI (YjbR/CyaY-like superfamily)
MSKIPADLKDALVKAGLGDFFDGCTAAHQREYLKWIEEAKRPETRNARISQAVKMIAAKHAKETARAKK